jgi:lipid-A-disaccharide synthase-like uncharacterized protein
MADILSVFMLCIMDAHTARRAAAWKTSSMPVLFRYNSLGGNMVYLWYFLW